MVRHVKKILLVLGIVLLVGFSFSIPQILRFVGKPPESPALVGLDENGQLAYVPYANYGENQALNVLPDFSHAGYEGGGVAIPLVPAKIQLESRAGDDRGRIQAAIDQVAALPVDANGIRGAVVLASGIYSVNGPLYLNASGIVLRGEGQGLDGTILNATASYQHNFLYMRGQSVGLPLLESMERNVTSEYVGTGSVTFQINSTSGYAVGDPIVVVRTPNQNWIDTLDMAQYGWTAESYAIKHERVITKIEGNNLTIDIPLVDPIQAQYGGGYICKTNVTGRIFQSGLENIRLCSAYDLSNTSDEDHAWKAIVLSRTVNCWVKQVTAQYFGYACVSIEAESNFNTVQDCAMLDPISITTGSRKYSFNIGDGLGNLLQRCFTRGGRHDFVTGSRVTGPNVFLDCLAVETHSDIGPHHRWATGTLFDNIRGGETRVRNRGASGTGHGWAGAQTMFWHVVVPNDRITVGSPRGAINWAVGCSAREWEDNHGYWVAWKEGVQPRSLYLTQLGCRLGANAVNATTVPSQRESTMWDQLASWAGEGTPPWLV